MLYTSTSTSIVSIYAYFQRHSLRAQRHIPMPPQPRVPPHVRITTTKADQLRVDQIPLYYDLVYRWQSEQTMNPVPIGDEILGCDHLHPWWQDPALAGFVTEDNANEALNWGQRTWWPWRYEDGVRRNGYGIYRVHYSRDIIASQNLWSKFRSTICLLRAISYSL